MNGWIFNASPVILLGKIRQLHLIESLSPGFRIPRPVVDEIGAGAVDDPAVKWLGTPSISDHIVDAVERRRPLPGPRASRPHHSKGACFRGGRDARGPRHPSHPASSE